LVLTILRCEKAFYDLPD